MLFWSIWHGDGYCISRPISKTLGCHFGWGAGPSKWAPKLDDLRIFVGSLNAPPNMKCFQFSVVLDGIGLTGLISLSWPGVNSNRPRPFCLCRCLRCIWCPLCHSFGRQNCSGMGCNNWDQHDHSTARARDLQCFWDFGCTFCASRDGSGVWDASTGAKLTMKHRDRCMTATFDTSGRRVVSFIRQELHSVGCGKWGQDFHRKTY